MTFECDGPGLGALWIRATGCLSGEMLAVRARSSIEPCIKQSYEWAVIFRYHHNT